MLSRWPGLKRRLVYADPREYWTLRGGQEYLREQEDHPTRTARSIWLAERIAAYRPASILEIGCGYGKQLAQIRARLDACELVGVDFSLPQLRCVPDFAGQSNGIRVVLGSGDRLPFDDHAFDMVFTSAVILHNPPDVAERIRREVVRVARRWAVHNEDTSVSYNRYGYDTAAWYRAAGYRLLECGPIPVDTDGQSQFCVAEIGGC
jgi:SAM-dependent methyltransferase